MPDTSQREARAAGSSETRGAHLALVVHVDKPQSARAPQHCQRARLTHAHRSRGTATMSRFAPISKLPGRLLIANRGEIAARILRTAARLEMDTVAVYTPADAATPHALQATESHLVDSYLDWQTLLRIAAERGVTAVHPGYGFLSENPDFSGEPTWPRGHANRSLPCPAVPVAVMRTLRSCTRALCDRTHARYHAVCCVSVAPTPSHVCACAN